MLFLFCLLFSQNTVLVPDYGHPETLASEYDSEWTGKFRQGKGSSVGATYLTDVIASKGHYWCKKIEGGWHWVPDGSGVYVTIPSAGYVSVSGSFRNDLYGAQVDSSTYISIIFYIYRDNQWTELTWCRALPTQSPSCSKSMIPVRKGDRIYYSTLFEGEIPPTYFITFYPAVGVGYGSE